MSLCLLLYLIGTLGFVLNRKNVILMLISIEIMLLSVTLIIIICPSGGIMGQILSTYIILIAAIESAIGLAVLVSFYRLRGNIIIKNE